MMISLISNRTKTAGQGRGAGAVSPLTFCSSCCCAARWRCAWRWRCRPAARCGLDVVGLLLLHCSLTARVPYVASWTRQRSCCCATVLLAGGATAVRCELDAAAFLLLAGDAPASAVRCRLDEARSLLHDSKRVLLAER